MRKSENTTWGVCIGAIGVFIVAGAMTASAARTASAADPQQPTAAERGAQSDDVAAGQKIYDRVCGRCHPHGNRDIGPSILNKNEDQTKMQKQIRQGSGRMRAINTTKLPEANMPALMAYLRSIHAVH